MEKFKGDTLASPEDEIEAGSIADAKKSAYDETDILLDYASILEDVGGLKTALDQFKGTLTQLEKIEAVLEAIHAKDNKENMKGKSLKTFEGVGYYIGRDPQDRPKDESFQARTARVIGQATEELAALMNLKNQVETLIQVGQVRRRPEMLEKGHEN